MSNPGISGPLFKWFGSKWLAAPKYPAPRDYRIFEPFAGSAGYSLRHYWNDVTIYDSNPLIAALWTWLINYATCDAIMAIPLGLSEGTDIRSLTYLNEGQKLLLKHWQRTNNYGDCWTISPWGNKPGQWTESTRKRVASEFIHIRHWKFRKVEFDEPGTYFVDPPYQYNYAYGVKDFDHAALAKKVQGIPSPSQVIACEAVCPKTKRVPDYLPFEFFGDRITSRRKEGNNTHSKELVYVKNVSRPIRWDWS